MNTGTRGCWSFFSSRQSLMKFAKAHGIEAAKRHIEDCGACQRRFVIVQHEWCQVIRDRGAA